MDKTVARLNVEYFHKKLATESDEARRQQILRLLAEEEAKSTALDAPKRKRR